MIISGSCLKLKTLSCPSLNIFERNVSFPNLVKLKLHDAIDDAQLGQIQEITSLQELSLNSVSFALNRRNIKWNNLKNLKSIAIEFDDRINIQFLGHCMIP